MYDQARPRNWLMIDAGQLSECHSQKYEHGDEASF